MDHDEAMVQRLSWHIWSLLEGNKLVTQSNCLVAHDETSPGIWCLIGMTSQIPSRPFAGHADHVVFFLWWNALKAGVQSWTSGELINRCVWGGSGWAFAIQTYRKSAQTWELDVLCLIFCWFSVNLRAIQWSTFRGFLFLGWLECIS